MLAIAVGNWLAPSAPPAAALGPPPAKVVIITALPATALPEAPPGAPVLVPAPRLPTSPPVPPWPVTVGPLPEMRSQAVPHPAAARRQRLGSDQLHVCNAMINTAQLADFVTPEARNAIIAACRRPAR